MFMWIEETRVTGKDQNETVLPGFNITGNYENLTSANTRLLLNETE